MDSQVTGQEMPAKRRRRAASAAPAPLSVEYRSLADLVPYAKNSRTHTPEQVSRIVASIREFGWTNPVLIGADGGVVAGHARVMAAKQAGVDPVPCIATGQTFDAVRQQRLTKPRRRKAA